MWRIGRDAEWEGDPRFGNVEINSGSDAGVLVMVLGEV